MNVQISDQNLQDQAERYFKMLILQAEERVNGTQRGINEYLEEHKRLEQQIAYAQESLIVQTAVLAQLKDVFEN